jgi:hypothetical protein
VVSVYPVSCARATNTDMQHQPPTYNLMKLNLSRLMFRVGVRGTRSCIWGRRVTGLACMVLDSVGVQVGV